MQSNLRICSRLITRTQQKINIL